MSTFENISSIVSLEQLNNSKINENKDYIILFFYMDMCSHCETAKPVICKIIQNNLLKKNSNCKIVKVHNIDIKDNNLKNMYNGGVPAFRILKHTYNGYVLFDYEKEIPNKKYGFTTDGFAHMDYVNGNIKHLSTENTLLNWIDLLSKLPIKENYVNVSKTSEEDDGSGYTIMRKYSQNPFHKSLNKIINENIRNIERNLK
jgi:hypothetical protein